MTAFLAILKRDVQLAFKQGGGAGMAIAFFFLTVALFPLGVGPEANILSRISAGVIWVAALLATMLSLDRIFQADFDDGSLELLAMTPLPLHFIVLAKCLAHWLTTGLPLIAAAPLLAIQMQMDAAGFTTLMVSRLLCTMTLSLIGAVGAALTIGVRRGGVLLSLLVLPFFIPVLIFGVGAVDAAINGLGSKPQLLILGAMLLMAGVLSPLASAAAIRLSLQ